MKLLQQTNRYYLIISGILFLLTGILLYIFMSIISKNEINEKLNETKNRVIEHLRDKQEIPNLYPVIEVIKVPSIGIPLSRDTIIYDPVDHEYEKYKEEIVYKTINGTQYKLTLRRSLKENRVLMFSTTFSMIFILFLLFIAFFFTNRYISKKIWTSFYHNLNTIKHFSLTLNPSPLHLLPSKIQEFNELNEAIENLSRKVVSDYRILKEFTENASHETQTPLTVIISRLEILLQSGDLTNGQVKNIYPAYRAAKRLSILNKNLLLLSRIEHERFKKEPVYLDKILITQLNLLDVFIQSKKLTVHFQPPEKHVIFKGNQYQTEILISNLLKNATLHNITGGKISIFLTEKDLIIENTGKPLSIEPDKLFERFRKADSSSQSSGLGLAIVKQICRNLHWIISYTYTDGIHVLKIVF